MMKHLTLGFILISVCLLPRVAAAQDAGQWVSVAPSNEKFRVEMPQEPSVKKQKNKYDPLDVSALVYTAAEGDTTYTLWSLKNNSYKKAQPDDTESYLDNCAELVWEELLTPLRDTDPQKRYIEHMSYQGELKDAVLPGREYSIKLKKAQGRTHIYVSGERIYVLMVLSATPDDAGAQRFLQSFNIGKAEVTSETASGGGSDTTGGTQLNKGSGDAAGYGPGRGGNTGEPATGAASGTTTTAPTDYNGTFNTRQVTQKARIITRPEPQYTESARKFWVTGTIVLRGIFSKEGEVTNIRVMKRLPHGLTEQAIMAARAIRFMPAQKDGRPVSQYIQIEYNFNLY